VTSTTAAEKQRLRRRKEGIGQREQVVSNAAGAESGDAAGDDEQEGAARFARPAMTLELDGGLRTTVLQSGEQIFGWLKAWREESEQPRHGAVRGRVGGLPMVFAALHKLTLCARKLSFFFLPGLSRGRELDHDFRHE
jgi:hypothetical protein